MTVVGTLMLFGGQLLSIYGSLMNVTLQMAVLGVQSAETFSKMSAQSLTVGQLLRQQIMAPLAAIRKIMFRLTGLSVLFYLTWRYDFLRIRSIVTEFFGNIRKSSKDVNERLTTMTGDAVYEMTKLDLQSSNFWKRLTGYLTVSTILWRGFTEAIRNFREEGIFGLSNDLMSLLTGLSTDQLASMDEIDPNKFPLLRTLTSVLELIHAIKSAWDGFVEGMKEGYGVIENFILKPLQAIFGDILGESNLLDWDETAERYRPNIEAWEKMGKMVGNILSYTIAIKLALFAWKNTIGRIIKMGGKLKGAIFGGGDKKGLLSYLTGKGSFSRAVRKGTLRQARDIWPKGQYPEGIKPTNWIRTGKDLPFFSKIFGNRLYSYKTGQYLGREPVKGMPKFLSKGTKDYPVLGRLGNIRGLNLLMKTPVLGGISMLLGALGEEKGQRVKGAASAGVQFAGSMVGAKAGAAIGTAIMPGIGTIAGTIIGGITGAIVSSPFAEIIGNWIQDAYSWLVENVLNAEAITRIFEAIKKFFLETLPYNLGEWIGTLAAEGYLFITRVCTEDIPKWYEDTKQTLIGWFNNIGPSLREWWEKTGWEGVWNFIQTFLDAINPKNWIDRGWANLVEMGKNLAKGIKSGFNTAIANSKTSNGVTKTMPQYSYSHGGFITKPHVGLVGEDGPEAIIPLSSKYRSNALRLWGEVGKRIAEPGFSGAQRTTAHGGESDVAVVSPTGSGGGSINKTEIIFGENSIVLKFDSLSNTSDAKKAARELFSEFKKLMEEDNIRNYGVARQRA